MIDLKKEKFIISEWERKKKDWEEREERKWKMKVKERWVMRFDHEICNGAIKVKVWFVTIN